MDFRFARFVLLLVFLPACQPANAVLPDPVVVDSRPADTETPRNIILIVGDGMGTTHFTVLDLLRGEDSTLSTFTSAALVTTHSASSPVTDSGAAATAMAAGIKTTNGAISVTPEGKPVETVLERAEKSGKMTGLVTTTGFWDATPAAFAAHNLNRGAAEAIVPEMLSSGVDLVISAGAEKFGVEGRPTVSELAQAFGFQPVTTVQGLVPIQGKVLVLFPETGHDEEYPNAPLPVLTRYAIDHLSSDPDGFFLLIESEATDSLSHDNATAPLLESLKSLDAAVAVALEFARENGETIVLFTGDHETGAFQISGAGGQAPRDTTEPGSPPAEGEELKLEWFSGGHTGQALPLFAFGPGSERFSGWLDNTDIGKRLKLIVGGRKPVVDRPAAEE